MRNKLLKEERISSTLVLTYWGFKREMSANDRRRIRKKLRK